MVRNWKSVWDAIRYTPGASLFHLNGTRRADRNNEGTCVSRGQAKSDQGRKTSMESLFPPSSREDRIASGRKKATAVDATFFSLSEGS